MSENKMGYGYKTLQRAPFFRHVVTLLSILFSHHLYAADQLIIGIVLVSVMSDLSIPMMWSGAIATLFGLGMVFGSLITNWLIKKVGFVHALVMGLFTFSLFTVLTGVSLSAIDISIYRIGVGIGEAIWNVTYYAVFGTIYPKKRGLVSGLVGNMYILGIIWAHPVASLMLSWSNSWRVPFYVFGLSGLLISVLIMLIAKRGIFGRLEQQKMVKQDVQLSTVLKDRNIISGFVISLFAAINFYSIAVFYPTYLKDALKYDALFSSTITSIQMCAMLITGPLILYISDKYGRKPILYYSSLFLAPVLYFMFRPELSKPYSIMLLSIIYGAVNSGGFRLVVSYFQDLVAAPLIPLATSLCNIIFYIGSLISGPAMTYFVCLAGWENIGIWLVFCCLAYFFAAFIAKNQ